MTTNTTDIVQELVKLLVSDSSVTDKLGSTGATPWVFQDTLYARVEGTQSAAAVVSQVGGWAPPNEHNTARFPRLSVQFYVDPLRDDSGNITHFADTRLRANELFELVDRVLHRPQGGSQLLSTVRLDGSLRLTEPSWYAVPDGDGMVRGQVFYGMYITT